MSNTAALLNSTSTTPKRARRAADQTRRAHAMRVTSAAARRRAGRRVASQQRGCRSGWLGRRGRPPCSARLRRERPPSTARPMPPPAPVSSACRPARVAAEACIGQPRSESLHDALRRANRSDAAPDCRRGRSQQQRVAAERRAPDRARRRSHGRASPGPWRRPGRRRRARRDASAARKREEQRRQHARCSRSAAPRAMRSRSVGTTKPGIFEKPSIATRWLVSRTYGLPKRSSTTSR